MNQRDYQRIVEHAPEELKRFPNWVGFVIEPKNGRMTKVPKDVLKAGNARSNAPSTWTDFQTALDLSFQRGYDGIGFMFQSPFVGIDIDHCVENGVISSLAQEILSTVNSYSELSPSKTGIHIICKGDIPKACKISSIGLEVYTQGRYFTFTGDHLEQYPKEIMERTNALKEIYSRYVCVVETQENGKRSQIDITRLLGRIRQSRDGEKFIHLFEGHWQDSYPSQSEADLALCAKLAFWTKKDARLMDEFFRASKLYRAKWDERHYVDGKTYGQGVIDQALSGCVETYASVDDDGITQGEIITRDCEEGIKNYFRDQQGRAFVVLPFDNHSEVISTESSRFNHWMARRFREKYGAPPNTEAINQAKMQIEAKCASGQERELFNRVGFDNYAIYYDLTTPDWQGVRIDKNGWVVEALPSVFRRSAHQNQQIIPVHGHDANGILKFCNIHPDDACLFIVTIATFFIPNIPHVILTQNGEQGTGKSSNSRFIKALVDPSKVMLTSNPKDLEHAQMTAEKHWLSTFDNVSRISEWFSDFLCRGVTGEGDMKRSLYTNDDEFIRSYRRCFVINGIGMTAWRPDLLDRSIVLDIPILKERRPEKIMQEQWQKELPGILGGFFTAISKAMNSIDDMQGVDQFRMADFAQWGMALAEALGFSAKEFLEAYRSSVEHKWQDSAEENVLVNRLKYLVESNAGYWQGSATELLKKVAPENGFDKNIPANPRALSSELMRIAPVLRMVGIDISRSQNREPGTGRKKFVLSKVKGKEPVNVGVNNGEHCDYFENLQEQRPF